MSSPQLYAIVYGSPGRIQAQTLSHNQTAATSVPATYR